MPSNVGDEPKPYLYTDTEDIKLIADYTGYDFGKCMELDCYTYKLLVRDAFISKCKESEEGQEYLEDCWLLRQTKPDRKRLRENFGD